MFNTVKVLIIFLLFGVQSYGIAQELNEFGFSNRLPETLASEKSLVLIDIDESAPLSDWKLLSDSVHQIFPELGIDAVNYLRWQDAFAGIDVSSSIKEKLIKRNIKNIIIIKYERGNYSFTIAPFKDNHIIFNDSQAVFKAKHENLGTLLHNITQVVQQSGIERSNYLVLDRPEYFVLPFVVKGSRFYSYPPDLKTDKMAVPQALFLRGSSSDTTILSNETSDLKRIMQSYPYQYEIVTYNENEKIMRNAGFSFILMGFHTFENSIKEFVNYNKEEDSTSSYGKNQPVYKFYIKHIYSGDVYLGEEWDTALNWQQALQNYLNGLNEALNVKK